MGLSDKQNAVPKGFSGGMKRRLNIACAIVHQPKIIIMDEPTVGIDPQSINHILQSVKKLNSMGSTGEKAYISVISSSKDAVRDTMVSSIVDSLSQQYLSAGFPLASFLQYPYFAPAHQFSLFHYNLLNSSIISLYSLSRASMSSFLDGILNFPSISAMRC